MATSGFIALRKPSGRGWRIGLTGGMGSGKSTALSVFKEKGWLVLEADLVARQLLNEDPEIRQLLEAKWGADVFAADGSVDRAFVGSRVFSSPECLRWLEELLHPRVRAYWSGAFEDASSRNAIIEIPLLFEKELHVHFDATICLALSHELQIQRLAKRGVDRESAEKRLAKQLPTHEKTKRSDFVFSNEGSQVFLEEQVGVFLNRLNGGTAASRSA